MSFLAAFGRACFEGFSKSSISAYVGAVVVNSITGNLWYSDMMFVRPWMRGAFPETTAKLITDKDWKDFLTMECSKPDVDQKSTYRSVEVCLASAITGSTVSFFLLRGIINCLHAETALDGAAIGLVLSSMQAIFGICHTMFEGRSLQLHMINYGFDICCFTMAGTILASYK